MEKVNQYLDEQNKPQYRKGQEVELMDFLNAYPWQAWVHCTAEPGTSFDHIDKAVGAFRGRLAHLAKMQVATMGFFTAHPMPHAHVLLIGKNRFGRTLADLGDDLIKDMLQFWKTLMHRSDVEFSLLHDAPGAIRYIIQDNTIEKRSAAILSPRGIKLLQKIKTT